jgi:hypothetical protein
MSHFTTIRTEIYDLDILKQTLSDLGHPFGVEKKVRGFQGERAVDLAVPFGSSFCIGFKKNSKTKSYEICGEDELLRRGEVQRLIDQIRQEYAYRKVLQAARARGFALAQEERLKTGTIKLTLRKVA